MKFESISVAYGEGESPVIAVNGLTFPDTGITLLSGDSGVGKTTLLRALAGWLRGVVGVTIRLQPEVPVKNIRFIGTHEGMLPWYPVADNLKLLAGMGESIAVSALEEVGLSRAELGRMPYELSLGMYKRIELIAATHVQPRLLLVDDVLTALNKTTRQQAIGLLQRAAQTGAVIVVSHVALDQELPDAHRLRIVRTEFGGTLET